MDPGTTPRWPTVSVRTRIVLVITLVGAIAMLTVGVAVYAVERARILAQVDERLDASREAVHFIVAAGPGDEAGQTPWASEDDALRAVVQRTGADDNTGVLGIVDGEARFAPGFALDLDLESVPGFVTRIAGEVADGQPRRGTFAQDDVVWRYLAVPIQVADTAEPGRTVFTIAYDLDGELREIDEAARVFLIAAAIAVVVIAGVAGLAATRLLRPLRRMRQTAERVSARSLSERLPLEGRDDVSDLARTMNDMLDRLDEALGSQRRLLSDVGHELKTPITIVRGYVEVMDPEDPGDVRETQGLAIDELDRMGRLVQDLAGAAALHGPAPISPHPVDAADLVRQIIRKAEGIAGAQVHAGPVADVVAPLDAGRITQAMLQFAQNAVTHGGGRLVIGSRIQDDRLEFVVRDHGPGVPEEAKQRIFDRFQRGADAEGRGTAGSGLGLNIVQMIARAHGGSARVLDAPGGGALFVISVPVSAGAPAPASPERI